MADGRFRTTRRRKAAAPLPVGVLAPGIGARLKRGLAGRNQGARKRH